MVSKAFISLPTLLVLLFVLSLYYQFNQDLGSQRQWHYQTQQTLEKERIWQAFEFQVLSNLNADEAHISSCPTFCQLDMSESTSDNWPNQYQYKGEQVNWLLEKTETELIRFRLCAKRLLDQTVQCWWLKEGDGPLYWYANMPISH